MMRETADEVRRLGGDPTEETWRWFLLTGPHGADFGWSQRKLEPAGYVSLEHLRRILAEKTEQDPGFRGRIEGIVSQALRSNDPEIVRRAIQVAGASAMTSVISEVKALTGRTDPRISADARACLFVLQRT
jgi:hypothetical protein